MTLVETRTPEITKDEKEAIVELLSTYVDSDNKRINYEVFLKIL